MRFILRRCVSIGGFALCTFVLLLALLFSVSWAVLPFINDYRQDIQAHLSELLGRKISIGRISAGWRGTAPQMRVVDVRIYDDSGTHTELSVDSIFISLDIVNSLRNGVLGIKEIGLRGCDISIIRNPDNTVVIHGLELDIPSNRNMARLASMESLSESRVKFIGCRVGLKDAISGKDYRFDGVNASINSEESRKLITARLIPTENLARQLTVLMEFKGQLDQPRGWQGRFYIDARDLCLDAFLPSALLQEYGLEQGRLSFQNWSDWKQGKPIRMQGSFSLAELKLSSFPITVESEQPSARNINLIRSRYEWLSTPSGWRLHLGELKTVMEDRSWPESELSLEYRVDGDAEPHISGALDHVNLKQIFRLLPLLPKSPQVQGREWKRFSSRGNLIDTRFSLSLGAVGVERYFISSRFRDFDMPARDEKPGIAGLDGWIHITEKGGKVVIDSRNVLLHYPNVFENQLAADYFSAVSTWHFEDERLYIDNESLRLGNEDIEIVGEGSFILGEGSPFLDVNLTYGQGSGASLGRYLPKKIMPHKVHQWLERAIGDAYIATGTAVIRGRASEFPYVNGEGIFEVIAELERGTLDYKPGWPRLDDIYATLMFRGQSMKITNARAQVLDSKLNNVTVTIDNLRRAELHMRSEILGPLSDLWRFSRKTVLPSGDNRIIKDLWLEGNGSMKLDVYLPLSRRIEERASVAGELFLEDAVLELQEPSVKFENITGSLAFDPQGAQGQGINATLYGHPVIIGARPADFGVTVVEVQGHLGAGHLAQNLNIEHLREGLARSLTGTSDWLAQVTIPHGQLKDDNRKISFKIWSDLKGIGIQAPEPLTKAAATQEAFFLGAELGIEGALPLRVQYGRHLSLALSLRKIGDDYALDGAEIRFYRGEASVPSAHGIKVLGTLPRYSLDAWRTWVQSTFEGKRWRKGARNNGHMPIAMDIDIHRFELFGQVFEDLAVLAERHRGSWRLQLDSQAVKGVIIVPEPLVSGAPIQADLEYLELQQRPSNSELIRIDPRLVPALQIKSKTLRYGGLSFGGGYLHTSSQRDGMTINDLFLDAGEFSLRVNGQWNSARERVHHTQLNLVLDSNDFGAMMQTLHFSPGLESGSAKITAKLQFPTAPFQWGYDGLSGKAHIELKQGQFGEFEPGPWRVLGLMNIDTLSRRLSLNFSDLVKKGFSYDSIEGNFDIEGSNVFTSDLQIKGPSADLVITGRIGLEARDYDQMLSVTSKVSTGVSVAGALLGGVGVGAAIFVADRIINSMGGSIDNVTRLNYKITGSWDDPTIELMSPSVTDDSYYEILDDDVG